MRLTPMPILALAALLLAPTAAHTQTPIPVGPGDPIRVEWDASEVNETGSNAPEGYQVETFRESDTGVTITTTRVPAHTLTVELPWTIVPEGTFLLAVRAYNSAGFSGRSNALLFESVTPVDPEEPGEPTDPEEPVDPEEPEEPTDPEEPEEPVDPEEPSGPVQPEPPGDVRPVPPEDTATYEVQTFTESGMWTRPAGVTQVDVVVVGGGGGGGAQRGGGGGGAGGVRAIFGLDVAALDSVPVTVGAGGAGTTGGSVQGRDGEPSAFGTFLQAVGGGGGGGTGLKGAKTLCDGRPGGSGGGAASTCEQRAAGAGTANEGHDGGRSYYGGPSVGGSGGGGAAGPGTGGAPKAAGLGGPGVTLEMTDGLFAGARGGNGGGPGVSHGQDGAPHTGDGGGGGGREDLSGFGGAGGSGVVIVRWVVPAAEEDVVYTVADDITTVRVPAHRHDVRICVEQEGEDATDVCVVAGELEEPMPDDELLDEPEPEDVP